MPDRVARLEDKVDQLTALVAQLTGELKHFRQKAPEAAEETPLEPRVEPGDYYGLYTVLFDDWLRGNRRSVIRKLRGLKLEEMTKMAEAARLPLKGNPNREEALAQLKEIFKAQEVKSRASQYSGLYCLLQTEWSAQNREFVEGRLNEFSVAQLRDIAAGQGINLGRATKRPGIISAIEKHLEANKTPVTEASTMPRTYRDPTDEALEYTHRTLFDEWNAGNCSYVYTQLENMDTGKLRKFIKVNKLPVKTKPGRRGVIEELGKHYERMKNEARTDQFRGFYMLLATEWGNKNRAFVSRRLEEMDQKKLAEFAEAAGIKAGRKSAKPGIIRAIKEHLEAGLKGK